MNTDMIDRILEIWSKFDHQATGYIKIAEFESFMRDLGEPIGWGPSDATNSDEKLEFVQ